MQYAIVYSSQTGNTRLLADTLHKFLSEESCLYFGEPEDAALSAQRLYIGFWTDKGCCDKKTALFLSKLKDKEVFLFGTAGFGGEKAYFEKILNSVKQNLNESNIVIGEYMCQGKMPMSVKARYEKMQSAQGDTSNVKSLIENFDQALSHPDKSDLDNFLCAVAI